MHVGRAQRDGAERRRLECELISSSSWHHAAAAAIARAGADVVELVVGETPAVVAGEAIGLAGEQREAALGGGTIALSSPAIQRSNGVVPGSSVRSNAASAVAIASTSMGRPGRAALNFAA